MGNLKDWDTVNWVVDTGTTFHMRLITVITYTLTYGVMLYFLAFIFFFSYQLPSTVDYDSFKYFTEIVLKAAQTGERAIVIYPAISPQTERTLVFLMRYAQKRRTLLFLARGQ